MCGCVAQVPEHQSSLKLKIEVAKKARTEAKALSMLLYSKQLHRLPALHPTLLFRANVCRMTFTSAAFCSHD